jgi:creatinine amidohydrolase
MTPEVRWERMFPDQLEASFAEKPLVYFTYGLCEPHGPHNALGLDGLKAYGIACETARRHGGIVAPPDWWHIHELSGYAVWSHQNVGEGERTWLTSLPPWQHFKNVCYHLRTADSHGFKAAIFLTGHYGPNWQDLKTMLELIQPHIGTRIYGLPDWEANVPGFDNDNQSGGDHAGKVETSLLWALNPECVDLSRLPDPMVPTPNFATGATAKESNRLVGERMVEDEIVYLKAKADALLAEYEQAPRTHSLRTYEQVEQLWDEVVRPVLKDFRSMQDLWDGQPPVPEDSRWHENWRVPDRG